MQIFFILLNIYYDFLHDSPPTFSPSLSLVWVPKFSQCPPNPILSLPRNHAFTIKTSASYLEKSLSTSKLLISALEIHWHFVAFSCPPFCLLFSKPNSQLFLDREITLTTNEIIDLACVIVCMSSAGCTLGTPRNRQKSWTAATVGTVSHDLSRKPHKKG